MLSNERRKCCCQICATSAVLADNVGIAFHRTGGGVFVTDDMTESGILGNGSSSTAYVAPLYVEQAAPGSVKLNDDGSLPMSLFGRKDKAYSDVEIRDEQHEPPALATPPPVPRRERHLLEDGSPCICEMCTAKGSVLESMGFNLRRDRL